VNNLLAHRIWSILLSAFLWLDVDAGGYV